VPASVGDGWTVTAGTMQILRHEFSAVPHAGLTFAYLDYGYAVNTLSQTFATTPGQSYELTYYIADTVTSYDLLTVTFGGTVVYNEARQDASTCHRGDKRAIATKRRHNAQHGRDCRQQE